MNSRKRPLLYLVLSSVSFISLTVFIVLVAPDTTFFQMIPVPYLSYSVLFLLLSAFLFTFGTYIFKSKIHGILIALFAMMALLLRLNNLTHPIFFILLAALFLTLELFVSYRK